VIILLFVFLTLVSLGLLLWQASNIISVFFGSPYVIADRKVITYALKLADLKKGEIFYDLGCGNGDTLIEAVRLGAKAIGFEISPFYFLWAKFRIFIFKKIYHFLRWSGKSDINYRYRPTIEVKFQNINKVDLKKADVVYCYLLPELIEKMRIKFKKTLKRDARLISIGFPIRDLPSANQGKIKKHSIYLYRF